jgi:hypothetical protein
MFSTRSGMNNREITFEHGNHPLDKLSIDPSIKVCNINQKLQFEYEDGTRLGATDVAHCLIQPGQVHRICAEAVA